MNNNKEKGKIMDDIRLGRVSGEVSVSENSNVVTIWAKYSYTYQGEQKQGKQKWSIWFDYKTELQKGDWALIEGDLTVKVTEWTTPEGVVKQLPDINLNNPRILEHTPKFGAAKPEAEPAPKPRDPDDEYKYGGMPF